ncbi:MAG: phosphatase PAP2 family protein [Candidatus Zixiibacteriota bacterium]|nr:MAG: phosphatase PAP2 family protein [candidate division Zixibacteria bacterium]
MRKSSPHSRLLILILALLAGWPGAVTSQDFLDADEVILIGGASAGLAVLGEVALKTDKPRPPLIAGPLPLESRLQRLLGGSYHTGKTNFLDSDLGSLATPMIAGAVVLSADLAWSVGDEGRTALQDFHLFASGLVATKGITSVFKGLTARERPLLRLHPDRAARRDEVDALEDRRSFFSGHASSSFFAATFLNKRLRAIMRARMAPGEYRDWRWAPPALLFGWASFVGWSRIHAYKHFVSDVLVGAMAGYLLAELFHSFGEKAYSDTIEEPPPALIKITLRF